TFLLSFLSVEFIRDLLEGEISGEAHEAIIARYDVKRERVIPSDARSAYCTLYRKQVCGQRRV
ncbi:hypothetical protein, partial [Burkholderia multivorans]|uniref:hypothetical protein n=1 Tax=Burkholderia multivorans TaxID=87883 RepID=UPI0019D1715E